MYGYRFAHALHYFMFYEVRYAHISAGVQVRRIFNILYFLYAAK